MNPILAALAADKNVAPGLRNALLTPQQAAAKAKRDYLDDCAAKGREPDPVMADETYYRALSRAGGRAYYSGD